MYALSENRSLQHCSLSDLINHDTAELESRGLQVQSTRAVKRSAYRTAGLGGRKICRGRYRLVESAAIVPQPRPVLRARPPPPPPSVAHVSCPEARGCLEQVGEVRECAAGLNTAFSARQGLSIFVSRTSLAAAPAGLRTSGGCGVTDPWRRIHPRTHMSRRSSPASRHHPSRNTRSAAAPVPEHPPPPLPQAPSPGAAPRCAAQA
eukprot:scaffold4037_cov400-Prasinococcus_capsulatus_cf.AAC.11